MSVTALRFAWVVLLGFGASAGLAQSADDERERAERLLDQPRKRPAQSAAVQTPNKRVARAVASNPRPAGTIDDGVKVVEVPPEPSEAPDAKVDDPRTVAIPEPNSAPRRQRVQYRTPLRAHSYYSERYVERSVQVAPSRDADFECDFDLDDPAVITYMPRREYNVRDMSRRKDRLISASTRAVAAGLELLRSGEYERAALSLRLAADLHHGDAATRVHLAQALLATNQTSEAGLVLRRALSLQPKLAYLRFDLAADYPATGDFDRLVDNLAARLRTDGGDGDEHFLLGFMRFQQGRTRDSAAAFRDAHRAGVRDDAIGKYLELTDDPTTRHNPDHPRRRVRSAGSGDLR